MPILGWEEVYWENPCMQWDAFGHVSWDDDERRVVDLSLALVMQPEFDLQHQLGRTERQAVFLLQRCLPLTKRTRQSSVYMADLEVIT